MTIDLVRWRSLSGDVIPELNGGRVIIAVPPGLYMSLQSIYISEVIEWECHQCLLLVALKDATLWGFFYFVFVSVKHAMSTSYYPMLSHISSNVWWPEDSSKLLIFWKIRRVWLWSFWLVIRSPNERLRWRSSLLHRNESSSLEESE